MDDRPRPGTLTAALLAGMTLLSSAGNLLAQDQEGLRLDARAGIAVPTADMRNFVDESPVIAAGIGFRLDPMLWVRGDWTAALMRATNRWPLIKRGAELPLWGSETDIHYLTAGMQIELSEFGADVEVRAHGGLGAAFLSTEGTQLAEGGEFTQFALDGGLELAVPLGERVRIVWRGDLYVMPFRAGGPSHLKKEVVLPFTAGLAVGL